MAKQMNVSRGRPYPVNIPQVDSLDFLMESDAEEQEPVVPVEDLGPDRLIQTFDALDKALPLPDNYGSFARFVAAALIVVGGMMVQLLLSSQTLQSKAEQAELMYEHTIIERDNGEILWRIGRETNLKNVKARALKAGYIPIAIREYINPDGTIALAANVAKPGIADNEVSGNQSTVIAAEPVLSESRPKRPVDEVVALSSELPVPVSADGNAAAELMEGLRVRFTQWRFFFSNNGESKDDGPSSEPFVEPVNAIDSEWSPEWLQQVIGQVDRWIAETVGQPEQ